MKKIFAFDIDGTLLSEKDKVVSSLVLKAIKVLRQKGHVVGLATGRNLEQVTKVVNTEDFDFTVLINGGYAKYQDIEIEKNLFTKEQVKKLKAYCDNLGWSYGVSDLNYVHALEIDQKMIDIHADFDTPLPKIVQDFNALDIYQFMVYENFERLEKVKSEIPYYDFYRFRVAGFDISLPHVAKNTGIEAVVNHLGMSLKDVVAFGDADNDVTMMQSVGLGIAMGNGTEQLKAEADYVTDDVDEEGIVNALIHFGYIKMEELK